MSATYIVEASTLGPMHMIDVRTEVEAAGPLAARLEAERIFRIGGNRGRYYTLAVRDAHGVKVA